MDLLNRSSSFSAKIASLRLGSLEKDLNAVKALALVPGSTELKLVDRPEPQITAADEVKVRVVRVGICGTDREEASGGRAKAPAGQTELVIGHEMLSQVVAVGSAVTRVK